MKLIKLARGALGCLFVGCSGIGLRNDAAGRKQQAVIFVTIWLSVAFLSILGTFSLWIYDLRDAYWKICPYKDASARSAGLGLFVVIGIPALWLAWSVGKEYSAFAKKSATWQAYVGVSIWFMCVFMSGLLNLSRYGSLVGLVIHVGFFAWLIQQYRTNPPVLAGIAGRVT
nr:hypothetical protein [Luteibacter rhizovicinus]